MAYNKTNNDAPELIEKVVYLNRVSKTVKGGRVMKFSAGPSPLFPTRTPVKPP